MHLNPPKPSATPSANLTRPAFFRALPRTFGPAAWAGLLILVSTLIPLLVLWVWRPLGLSPDEAHYWDWSLRLDWSYYSKGPLVAYLIRASCELFGPLSVAVTGDLAAAVRMPAVACHAALLAGWYVLAAGVFRSPWLGLGVVAAAAALPIVRMGAVLMTIDPPFLTCWCWALVCAWRAVETNKTAWWAGAGVLTALGILAKYTMMLFPAAVVGFLVFHRRGEFRRPGVWLFLAGSLLGWVPVVVWNAQHDWVTFRHVFGQVGVSGGGGGLRWTGPLGFAADQLAVAFGFWLVAFLAGAWRFRPARESDPGVRLLWWTSVPAWCLFAAASVVKTGQANWPAACYAGGLVLAAAWAREALAGSRPRLVVACAVGSAVAGLVVSVVLQFPTLVRPAFVRIVGEPTEHNPFPVRRLDLTARLAGWRELAATVDEVRERVRAETGREPMIVGTYWTIPGILRFYCAGHPEVYSIGSALGVDRNSQYDVWRPNPVADAQEFRGRTFILVVPGRAGPITEFDRVEPGLWVVHSDRGIPLSGWEVRVAHGFRGFEAGAKPRGY